MCLAFVFATIVYYCGRQCCSLAFKKNVVVWLCVAISSMCVFAFVHDLLYNSVCALVYGVVCLWLALFSPVCVLPFFYVVVYACNLTCFFDVLWVRLAIFVAVHCLRCYMTVFWKLSLLVLHSLWCYMIVCGHVSMNVSDYGWQLYCCVTHFWNGTWLCLINVCVALLRDVLWLCVAWFMMLDDCECHCFIVFGLVCWIVYDCVLTFRDVVLLKFFDLLYECVVSLFMILYGCGWSCYCLLPFFWYVIWLCLAIGYVFGLLCCVLYMIVLAPFLDVYMIVVAPFCYCCWSFTFVRRWYLIVLGNVIVFGPLLYDACLCLALVFVVQFLMLVYKCTSP